MIRCCVFACVLAVLPAASARDVILAAPTQASGAPVAAGDRMPQPLDLGDLTLDEARELNARQQPRVIAARLGVEAARRRVADAGRPPNPELAAGVENIGGHLPSGAMETSLGMAQPFELGGDRGARAALAGAVADRERAAAGRVALDEDEATTELFLEAWALQERVHLLLLAESVAADAVTAAARRLEAGAAPPYEKLRAASFLAVQEIARSRLEADLAGVRGRLAVQLGGNVAFDSLRLDDPADGAPASDAAVPEAHPDEAFARAVQAESVQRLRLARAARVPDLSVAAGVKHLGEADGFGFTAGIAIPLPLWNTSSGAVDAAESEAQADRLRGMQLRRELGERLRAARRDFDTALGRWRRYEQELRPAAAEALAQVAGAYRAGRLSYLDIQEAQRHRLEIEQTGVDARADAWRARAVLERLVGSARAAQEER